MSKEEMAQLYETYKKALDDWMLERQEIVVKPMDILGFHRSYVKGQCQQIATLLTENKQVKDQRDAMQRRAEAAESDWQIAEAENKRLKKENLKLEISLYRQQGQEPPDIPKFKDYHKQKAPKGDSR